MYCKAKGSFDDCELKPVEAACDHGQDLVVQCLDFDPTASRKPKDWTVHPYKPKGNFVTPSVYLYGNWNFVCNTGIPGGSAKA